MGQLIEDLWIGWNVWTAQDKLSRLADTATWTEPMKETYWALVAQYGSEAKAMQIIRAGLAAHAAEAWERDRPQREAQRRAVLKSLGLIFATMYALGLVIMFAKWATGWTG